MARELTEVDPIVIGDGPTGIVGPRTAAQVSERVALVDSQAELGETTIPTESLSQS